MAVRFLVTLLLGCAFTIDASALVISEELYLLEGTNPDGSAAVGFGTAGLTNVASGEYGSYSITNDTDYDILGFAVSNSSSELAFRDMDLGGWAAWNLDASGWGTAPIMFNSLIGVALAQARIAIDGTPLDVFGGFADNFGADTGVNLYFARQFGSEITPGTTVLPGSFMFAPPEFASSYVAFGVTPGRLASGSISTADIQLLTGTAQGDDGGGQGPGPSDPVQVPEPGSLPLLVVALVALGMARRLSVSGGPAGQQARQRR